MPLVTDPQHTLDAVPSFVPPADFPPATAAVAALTETARASMDAEWRAGNRVPAEWYFDRAPALRSDESAALDVVYLEFLLREEAGDDPRPDEFASRFPELAPRLLKLLAFDSALSALTGRFGGDTVSTATASSASQTSLGTLGRYVLATELGTGGQADVFLAVHPTLGREVVVKRLKATERGAAAAERLRTEGRILASLDHPNLAKVYDLDVADGRPFMVMELIRGRSLYEVRRHAAVPPADAARWVAGVARAAHHAHGRGVLHLDIKPRNISLEDTGRPVLLDFGLARLDHAFVPPGTETGISGTLAYMAPEQAAGEHGRIGPPTDVYGLGGVLYFLLTGHDPIPEGKPAEVYARARDGDWDRDRLSVCGAPARLIRLCERALHPDPAQRFASAAEFADALDAAVRPRRWPAVAGLVTVAAAALILTAIFWPRSTLAPDPTPVAQQALAALPKPELRLTFDIYRKNKFFADFPTPFTVGEVGRVKATIPANHHAAFLLVTESGAVTELARTSPESAEHTFAYPRSADSKEAKLLKLAEPAGTHVFILAVSPSGRVSAEGLKAGERWPRLPYDSVIRLANGRAEVLVKGRDVAPGGAVADPEGEVVARLETLLRAAPPDGTVEAIAFGVKPK